MIIKNKLLYLRKKVYHISSSWDRSSIEIKLEIFGIKKYFFRRKKNWSTTWAWNKDENQQQTKPTYETYQTQTTLI